MTENPVWQTPPPRSSRRAVWAAIAIVAVAAAVGAVVVVLHIQDTPRPVVRDGPAPTVSEPEEDLPRFGAQHLLIQGPSGASVKLRGRPMYNACGLLPESQVTALGLKIDPFVHAVSDHLSRDVVDPRLTGSSAVDASWCAYFIESLAGTIGGDVTIAVQQVPFNDGDSPAGYLKDKTEGYRREGIEPRQTAGVWWYRDAGVSDPDRHVFHLFRPEATDTLFTLRVGKLAGTYAGKPRQQIIDELIAGVAAGIVAGPKGPVRYTYAAPYEDVKVACDVFTPELFQEYAGEPDSGLVEESFSRGEVSFSELGKVLGLHVESACVRRNVAEVVGSGTGVTLEVEVQPFRDQPQAERVVTSFCESQDAKPGAVEVHHKIGVATCLFLAGYDTLVFQVGRYNVWVKERANSTSPETLIQRLLPIAEKIAAELR